MSDVFYNKIKAWRYQFHFKIEKHLVLSEVKISQLKGLIGQAFDMYDALYPSEKPLAKMYLNGTLDNQYSSCFVLEPPMTRQRYFEPGDTIHWSLVLFGEAHEEYFNRIVKAYELIPAIEWGVKKGRIRLETIDYVTSGQQAITCYEKGVLLDVEVKPFTACDISLKSTESSLYVEAVTPLRIFNRKDNGKRELVKHPDFTMIVKRLLNRAHNVYRLYCGGEQLDYREFHQGTEAVRVVYYNDLKYDVWKHKSQKKGQLQGYGGYYGGIEFEGDWHQWYPLLKLGEYLHCGSNTGSLGLGKIQVKV